MLVKICIRKHKAEDQRKRRRSERLKDYPRGRVGCMSACLSEQTALNETGVTEEREERLREGERRKKTF